MNTVNRDRAELKRLVESYGKKDVLNYINHLNEDEYEDAAVEKYSKYGEVLQLTDNYIKGIGNILDETLSQKKVAYSRAIYASANIKKILGPLFNSSQMFREFSIKFDELAKCFTDKSVDPRTYREIPYNVNVNYKMALNILNKLRDMESDGRELLTRMHDDMSRRKMQRGIR